MPNTYDFPSVLKPFIAAEGCSVKEAARLAGKSPATIRAWAATREIGRRVADGNWLISRPALLMLLEANEQALQAYWRGDRSSPCVQEYFERTGVHLPSEMRHAS